MRSLANVETSDSNPVLANPRLKNSPTAASENPSSTRYTPSVTAITPWMNVWIARAPMMMPASRVTQRSLRVTMR